MKLSVPFYSQSWNLDEYAKLGYASRVEAEYWQKSCCGILCLKMAVDSLLQKENKPISPSVKKLIDLGVSLGFYSDKNGWSHYGLVEMIRSFGFVATARNSNITELTETLRKNNIPIVSIKWALQNHKTFKEKILFWKKYGGHLALLVGFEESSDAITGFYVHHTSKILEQNWEARFVPIKTFLAGYTGRGIIVGANNHFS